MKVINQVCRVLAVLLGAAAVVMFFFPFVNITTGDKTIAITGAQLAFGTKVAQTYKLAKSLYMLFALLLSAFATAMAGVSFASKKSKASTIASFVSALIGAILMLVIGLSKVGAFTDYRPLIPDAGTKLAYSPIVFIIMVALLACAALGIVGWLIKDYLEVLASRGQKLTIWQKVVKFVRDMVSEVKKIVWPNGKTVVKNSGIVLVLCAILGAFIWIIDWLLGLLVNFITTL